MTVRRVSVNYLYPRRICRVQSTVHFNCIVQVRWPLTDNHHHRASANTPVRQHHYYSIYNQWIAKVVLSAVSNLSIKKVWKNAIRTWIFWRIFFLSHRSHGQCQDPFVCKYHRNKFPITAANLTARTLSNYREIIRQNFLSKLHTSGVHVCNFRALVIRYNLYSIAVCRQTLYYVTQSRSTIEHHPGKWSITGQF